MNVYCVLCPKILIVGLNFNTNVVVRSSAILVTPDLRPPSMLVRGKLSICIRLNF